jgi:hypothetical protein
VQLLFIGAHVLRAGIHDNAIAPRDNGNSASHLHAHENHRLTWTQSTISPPAAGRTLARKNSQQANAWNFSSDVAHCGKRIADVAVQWRFLFEAVKWRDGDIATRDDRIVAADSVAVSDTQSFLPCDQLESISSIPPFGCCWQRQQISAGADSIQSHRLLAATNSMVRLYQCYLSSEWRLR